MNNFVVENSYRCSVVEMFSLVMKICEILIKMGHNCAEYYI